MSRKNSSDEKKRRRAERERNYERLKRLEADLKQEAIQKLKKEYEDVVLSSQPTYKGKRIIDNVTKHAVIKGLEFELKDKLGEEVAKEYFASVARRANAKSAAMDALESELDPFISPEHRGNRP
jgi:hypothetical protein